MSKIAKQPVIFVTGIGQTWATLKDTSVKERWNLIPGSKEILFRNYKVKDYLRLGAFAFNSAVSLFTPFNVLSEKLTCKTLSSLLTYCIADEKGDLPEDVDLKIYGSRSFEELRRTDFIKNTIDEKSDDTLLKRIYRDISCERYIGELGEENIYCFNYSAFSNLYRGADRLHEMIKEVIKDQKDKTGAEKVVLIPMSMGATVVNAYIDKYLGKDAEECFVSKIVSIVGAWDGSDALADLITFNVKDNFKEELLKLFKGKSAKIVGKIKEERLKNIGRKLVNAFTESTLLRVSSFMALIPEKRYGEIADITKKIPFENVKKEAERYNLFKKNMKERFYDAEKNLGVSFYFISGYNLKFGDDNKDFDFFGLFKSGEKSNTDAVIQISSTAPGTTSVPVGEKIRNVGNNSILSPEKNIDASTCWYKDTSWYFSSQQHELGSNNTALKLAFDIALGKVENVNGKYPQFNKMRDVGNAYELLEEAERTVNFENTDKEKSARIMYAADKVKTMLDNVFNDPENDNILIENLRKAIE